MMGDCNIVVLDQKNLSTIKLLDMIRQFGLRKLNREPTRYSEAKDLCIIGLFITNSKLIDNF